jgi:hypothetical protein
VDLGEYLVADARFVRCVGKERGVEERRERRGDRLGSAVGLEGEESMARGQAFACLKAGFALEDGVRGADWALISGFRAGNGGLNEVHYLARECDPLGDAVFVLQAVEGSSDFPGQVEGEREPAFRQATPGLGPFCQRLRLRAAVGVGRGVGPLTFCRRASSASVMSSS